MNFFNKNNPDKMQFFSLSKVKAIQQRAQDIEAQKKQKKIEASNCHTEKIFECDQKAHDVQKRKKTRIC